MNRPRIINLLKRKAREAQTLTGAIGVTGKWSLGPISVHYYPVCGRFTFFLYDLPISQRRLVTWMTAS